MTLDKYVKVYIPSLAKDGSQLRDYERKKAISGMAYFLSMLNGGCTQYEGIGYWLDRENVTIKEKVTVIESFTDDLSTAKIVYLRDMARQFAVALRQESLAIEINGVMEFVE